MGHIYESPPPGAAADRTIPQQWEQYTAAEHNVWDTLFARQAQLLPDRVVPDFIDGLKLLKMADPGIPNFERLSERLMKTTGWQVVAVPGLVPHRDFFEHLANRRFVAGRFIRRPEQLDYLQEPDVFHDVFGHVPLLAHPVYADYLQAYGEGGLRAVELGAIDMLARLYWYTVEFGLIRHEGGLRLFGAGIVDLTRYFWSMFNVHKRDRRRGRWRSRDTRPRRSFISFGRRMCWSARDRQSRR